MQNTSLRVSEVVFYQPGTIKLSATLTLTATMPCIVMVRMSGNTIEKIAVSDPAEKLTSLELQVNVPLNLTGDNFRSTWNRDSKFSTIEVDLPAEGNAGKSVVMEMKK